MSENLGVFFDPHCTYVNGATTINEINYSGPNWRSVSTANWFCGTIWTI